jgi:hypothetical protein
MLTIQGGTAADVEPAGDGQPAMPFSARSFIARSIGM